MLSKVYHGVRLDLYDLDGVCNVLTTRVNRGERADFHEGARAGIDILARHDLRDQSEFFEVFDSIYNQSEQFYTVEKEQ